jgi:NAD-dependent deacetylase
MKKIVVLSGAGISAESGISTFRDNNGLWEKYNVEDVATPEGWNRNPTLVLDFYNQRRQQLFSVNPNKAHYAFTELEKDFDVQVITQNVDNLHERAGNSKVLHLHGELTKIRSDGPGQEVFELNKDNYIIQIGDKCPKGYQLRPHIVWFGEAVPEFDHAIELTKEADIFLIIGTSLKVYPAAGLTNFLKKDTAIYLIDPKDVDIKTTNTTILKKGAIEGMMEFMNEIVPKIK